MATEAVRPLTWDELVVFVQAMPPAERQKPVILVVPYQEEPMVLRPTSLTRQGTAIYANEHRLTLWADDRRAVNLVEPPVVAEGDYVLT